MRTLGLTLPAVSILIITGLLYASAAPAYACVCVPLDETAEARVAAANVIVRGEMAAVSAVPEGAAVTLNVHEYLKGSGPPAITIIERGVQDLGDGRISTTSCSFFGLQVVSGEFVLFLSEADGPFMSPGNCGGAFRIIPTTDQLQLIDDVLAITGPAVPPSDDQPAAKSPLPDGEPQTSTLQTGAEGEDRDFPIIPAAILAIILPLAFLLGTAFLPPRRP